MWTPDPSQIITAEQRAAETAAAARLAEFPHLEPDQFWFILRVSGYEQPFLDWVESLRTTLNDPESPDFDPVDWAQASAKLQFAKFFERDHPLVEAARSALGMSATELDDLWRYGAG